MQITFRDVDYSSDQDCQLIVDWQNDETLRHLSRPNKNSEIENPPQTLEHIREQSKKEGPYKHVVDLMILESGRPIGQCDMLLNPPHCLTKEGVVAWFGIIIGESECRGKGIGKTAIHHLESHARAHGATSVEVGAFEFNTPSIRMFQSLGYTQIGRIEEFTHWNGKKWADIRFKKDIAIK